MSWIVIVTPTEGVGDFEVVGAFADRKDASEWVMKAFLEPQYKDCLLRIKEMRSKGPEPNFQAP